VCGVPEKLIGALVKKGVNNLRVASNNPGIPEYGIGKLIAHHQISRLICSYIGDNKLFEQQYMSGAVELELVPQGSLAEKIRAGRSGIPAFYTATGANTIFQLGGLTVQTSGEANKSSPTLSPPKEVREFGGKQYVLEEVGDIALILCITFLLLY
jgi:acyl CoA:acetate/3-ketoacid CoA transferase alpha subunit